MAEIVLKHVYKRYQDGTEAVRDCNITIKDKEFAVFVGPSGCGKSTTLRMIAGLEEISDGELLMDGKVINKQKANKRDIAMVFQNYALYPHMTVFENIAYSLKLKGISKKEQKKMVDKVAKILDIEGILERKPKELSGGQKQRVAIGRAIVRKPKAFLMDEPLSNLDAKLRNKMRKEIHQLYQMLQTTFIYVTHDQVEAMTLGNKIVVMKDGQVQQIATPEELYRKPANTFVAQFIGVPQMNLVRGKLFYKNNIYFLRMGNYELPISTEQGTYLRTKGYLGEEMTIGIRPEDVYFVKDDEKGIRVQIDGYELLGAETNLFVNNEEWNLCVQEKGASHWIFRKLGKIAFPEKQLHFFDKNDGRRI